MTVTATMGIPQSIQGRLKYVTARTMTVMGKLTNYANCIVAMPMEICMAIPIIV
jgi:hypothetical protein